MSRLVIEVSPATHRDLKLRAALEGTSLKRLVLTALERAGVAVNLEKGKHESR